MNNPPDSNQLLSETTFAVIDFETTGLSPAYGHRVCEVACLRICNSAELESFETLVNPGRSISPGAFQVNRITPEMLRGAPTFNAAAESLLRVMEGAVLAAHNAPFDLGFLAAELETTHLPMPDNLAIDTLALARRVYSFSRNSLSAVAASLGLENNATHRAMDDVRTTFAVLERILLDLERRWGVTKLGELIEFQGGSILYPHVRALPLPPTIADALENGGRVRMRYVDARGWETDRVVRPLRVSEERGNLYLVAYCYQRNALRTFRLDRVVEMEPDD
jgi:DNA polymerase-3 subunit epsilon